VPDTSDSNQPAKDPAKDFAKNPAKDFAEAYVDRNERAIALLNDSLFYFGELGMQEFESAKLMCDLLEEAGFKVERGIGGFPTAFSAVYGQGYPVIAIHTEYDSNPDNSQAPGIAEQRAIVEGAPGHCEGHNANGAVMVAGALAARAAMEKFGLKGTIKVVGAPAEEQLLSRPYLVRDGYFDDVDLAISPHIAHQFSIGYGMILSALISASFTFHGETAHAGMAPWKGRDALDGVVLMDVGMAQFREHMNPGMMCHRVITHGGDQPNVIPRTASVWWYFRDPTADGAMKLFEQAKDIAQGAALMTKTQCDIEILSAVWPVRGNKTAAELVQREYERIGAPAWTEEEQALAREVQTKVGVKATGLPNTVHRMAGPAKQKTAANDAGDISWKVPMAKLYFPGNIPNVDFHHWGAGVVLATSIAHKGAVAGSKVLANTVLECMLDPGVVEEAKRTFEEELGGVRYRSMMPPDQKPPLSLNAATMARYRDEMRKHYLKERPEFH